MENGSWRMNFDIGKVLNTNYIGDPCPLIGCGLPIDFYKMTVLVPYCSITFKKYFFNCSIFFPIIAAPQIPCKLLV